MQVPCNIVKDSFKTEDGREIEFTAFRIELNGETFSLFPKKDDKKLLNYLLAEMPEFASPSPAKP